MSSIGRGRQKVRPLCAGVVTCLAARGAHGERVSVHIDGRPAFSLSTSIAVDAGLHKDELLSVERQVALLEADAPNMARDEALAALARRERSEREIVDMLIGKGVSAEVAEQTGAWLREHGYVDDRRFALAYVSDRLRSGWGRHRIVSELVRKGVAREMVAEDGWQELLKSAEVDSESDQVVQLVRRRFAGALRADPQDARRKISGFLARRGHDWDLIERIIREVIDDADPSAGVS